MVEQACRCEDIKLSGQQACNWLGRISIGQQRSLTCLVAWPVCNRNQMTQVGFALGFPLPSSFFHLLKRRRQCSGMGETAFPANQRRSWPHGMGGVRVPLERENVAGTTKRGKQFLGILKIQPHLGGFRPNICLVSFATHCGRVSCFW